MILKKNGKKWVLITLIVIAIIPVVITVYESVFANNKSIVFLGNYHPNLAFLVISYYILLFCFAIYWFTVQLISVARLKNEKAKAELLLLKSQINPHFFFNVLNNLYGLVAKDSKQAQELILKLSDMMRYSIYEGERETVALEEEINYIKNYIELHKMRYYKEITVNFNYNVDERKKVIPLLFIMLIENAFKHGVENLRKDAYVNINMTSFKNKIQFDVENNYDAAECIKNKPGIGLKNLEQRLVLTYPNKHELSFSITENIYKVSLVLENDD